MVEFTMMLNGMIALKVLTLASFRSENTQSLGELLYDFFEYYAKDFR